jgi:hypothetical protein
VLGVSWVATVSADDAFAFMPTQIDQQPPVEFVSFRNGNLTESQDCDACTTQEDDCCDTWRQNLQVLVGANAFKSFGDTTQPPDIATGYMDSAGVLSGANTSFAIGERKVRGQIGGSYGIYDLKGRDTASPSSSEQQTFITAGFYKRSDIANCDRISWGVVYDQMFDHQYGMNAGELYLSQVRGIFGYAWNERNEFGVWGTARTNSDKSNGVPSPPPGVSLRAANQLNSYVRHNFDFGGSSLAYVGFYDPADVGSWSAGLLNTAPLSDNLSLYGNFSMMFPGSKTGVVGSNEEQWNAGVGLVYYFNGKSISPNVSGRNTNPLLPVADNTSFQVTD